MLHHVPRMTGIAALLLTAAALLAAAPASAEQLYRSVGPDGTVTYSDRPPSAPELGAAPAKKPASGPDQDVFQFGARSVRVPKPQGFEPIVAIAPNVAQVGQAYAPANRLVEMYFTSDDAKGLAAGKAVTPTRSFDLQVMRQFDGVAVSEKKFEEMIKQSAAQMERAVQAMKKSLEAETKQGNADAKRSIGVDPKIAVSGTEYLGVYRREPWGLFFTMKNHIATRGDTGRTMIATTATVLVNQQVLFLNASAVFHDESDQKRIEQAMSEWVDAIRKANLK